MFTTEDVDILQEQLDAVPVPMFAADRDEPGGSYRVVCVNRAHRHETGMGRGPDSGTGAPPGTASGVIFPFRPDQRLDARCIEALDGRTTAQFRQTVSIDGRAVQSDISLRRVRMPAGRDRVVGSTFPAGALPERTAASDAAFFAMQGQFHLARIAAFVAALEARRDLPADIAGHAVAVSGLCRSLDRVLEDIRGQGRHEGRADGHAMAAMLGEQATADPAT